MKLPTALESALMARHFARALGCNLIPCDVATRRPRVEWAHLHHPGSRRVTDAEFNLWTGDAIRRERAGEPTAWQILPGSGRLAVLDVDRPEALEGILERFGITPLQVFSPTPGRAHLWYRWPEDIDVGSVSETALGGAYGVKARGAAIHAPGSLHKSGAGFYRASLAPREWTRGLLARLPILDLAAVDADRVGRLDMTRCAGPESIADDVEGERRGRAYIAKAEHVAGTREQKTWRLSMGLGDLGLRCELASRLIVEWDAAGGIPRGLAEVEETVRRAYAGRRTPIGSRRHGDGGEDIDADALLADLAALTPETRAVAVSVWAQAREMVRAAA